MVGGDIARLLGATPNRQLPFEVTWGDSRTVALKGLSGEHEIWAVEWPVDWLPISHIRAKQAQGGRDGLMASFGSVTKAAEFTAARIDVGPWPCKIVPPRYH